MTAVVVVFLSQTTKLSFRHFFPSEFILNRKWRTIRELKKGEFELLPWLLLLRACVTAPLWSLKALGSFDQSATLSNGGKKFKQSDG